MFTVNDLVRTIDAVAPYKYALSWDNSGFLVGHAGQEVLKILVSLAFTETVLDAAVEKGANVIVTHHPYCFKPIARLTDETAKGSLILRLIENHISLLCAHTNLDAVSYTHLDVYKRQDMQDMEFTIENGKLYMLQTRNGKRTAAAAIRCV